MKWLKILLNKWVTEGSKLKIRAAINNGDDEEYVPHHGPSVCYSTDMDLHSIPNMTFNIYSAIGGRIVEFSSQNADKRVYTLYIIGKDEDFGAKIANIVTMESLRS
jgi:hypothetical protein